METELELTSLFCADNRIGDEGARAIALALKTNQAVTHIDLSCKCKSSEREWMKQTAEVPEHV